MPATAWQEADASEFMPTSVTAYTKHTAHYTSFVSQFFWGTKVNIHKAGGGDVLRDAARGEIDEEVN